MHDYKETNTYNEGEEVKFQGSCYRARTHVPVQIKPGRNFAFWEPIPTPDDMDIVVNTRRTEGDDSSSSSSIPDDPTPSSDPDPSPDPGFDSGGGDSGGGGASGDY